MLARKERDTTRILIVDRRFRSKLFLATQDSGLATHAMESLQLVTSLDATLSAQYGSDLHPAMIANGVSGRSKLEVLQHAGHVLHREQPTWVCKQLVEFLASFS